MPGLLSADDVAPSASPAPSAGLLDTSDALPEPSAALKHYLSPNAAGGASPFGAPVSNPAATETSQGRADQAHQLGVLGMGLVKGAASPVTAPADITIGAINWIKRHMGMGDDTLDTNASDLVNKGIKAAGLPSPQNSNESVLDTGGQLLGGGLTPKGANLQAGPGQWWRSSGPTGSANNKVLSNVVGQQFGIPYGTALTPDVLGKKYKEITDALDEARSSARLYSAPPAAAAPKTLPQPTGMSGLGLAPKQVTPAQSTLPNNVRIIDPAQINGTIGSIDGQFTANGNRLLNHPIVQNLLSTVKNGVFSAEDLGKTASNLGKAAKKVAPDDWQLSEGLFKTQDYVESMIKDGLPPEAVAAYEGALSKYRDFQPLLKPGMVDRVTGQIDAQAMANYVAKRNPKAFSLDVPGSPPPSPVIQVLRQVGASGEPTIPGSAAYHGALATAVKAAVRSFPQGAQILTQQGLQPGLRFLANKPGFVTALGEELANKNGPNDVSGMSGSNP